MAAVLQGFRVAQEEGAALGKDGGVLWCGNRRGQHE
jgi:hypothetical protein